MQTIAFGSVNDIRAQIKTKDAATFTVADVTVTVTEAETGVVIEDGVDGYADSGATAAAYHNVYHHGEFTEANGYAEGVTYVAEFRATATLGANDYPGAYAKVFFVLAAVGDA